MSGGLIELWKKRFYVKHFGPSYERIEEHEQFKNLDLDQLENGFYALLIGQLLSILSCLCEWSYKNNFAKIIPKSVEKSLPEKETFKGKILTTHWELTLKRWVKPGHT